MNLTTFSEERKLALEKWREYKSAEKRSNNPLYKDLRKVYLEIKRGHKIIRISKSTKTMSEIKTAKQFIMDFQDKYQLDWIFRSDGLIQADVNANDLVRLLEEYKQQPVSKHYEWMKASVELPAVKGYYIIRWPTFDKRHWLIKEDTFNPATNEEVRIERWKKAEVEWLKPVSEPKEDVEDIDEDLPIEWQQANSEDVEEAAEKHDEIFAKSENHVKEVREAARFLGRVLNEGAAAGHQSGYYKGYSDAMKKYAQLNNKK